MNDKAIRIIDENSWESDVDRLFLTILEHLSDDEKKLTKEYTVKEMCELCKEINNTKLKISSLNYPKNALFSNSKGRDYIKFVENIDVVKFTKDLNNSSSRNIEEKYGEKRVYINPKYIDAVYAGKNIYNRI